MLCVVLNVLLHVLQKMAIVDKLIRILFATSLAGMMSFYRGFAVAISAMS